MAVPDSLRRFIDADDGAAAAAYVRGLPHWFAPAFRYAIARRPTPAKACIVALVTGCHDDNVQSVLSDVRVAELDGYRLDDATLERLVCSLADRGASLVTTAPLPPPGVMVLHTAPYASVAAAGFVARRHHGLVARVMAELERRAPDAPGAPDGRSVEDTVRGMLYAAATYGNVDVLHAMWSSAPLRQRTGEQLQAWMQDVVERAAGLPAHIAAFLADIGMITVPLVCAANGAGELVRTYAAFTGAVCADLIASRWRSSFRVLPGNMGRFPLGALLNRIVDAGAPADMTAVAHTLAVWPSWAARSTNATLNALRCMGWAVNAVKRLAARHMAEGGAEAAAVWARVAATWAAAYRSVPAAAMMTLAFEGDLQPHAAAWPWLAERWRQDVRPSDETRFDAAAMARVVAEIGGGPPVQWANAYVHARVKLCLAYGQPAGETPLRLAPLLSCLADMRPTIAELVQTRAWEARGPLVRLRAALRCREGSECDGADD